jgi:hypothetical protein
MNNKRAMQWIGLVKVAALKEDIFLRGHKSAYTNAVGLAKSKAEFRREAKRKLQSIQLELVRLEGAEPLKDRLDKFSVSKDILQIAKTLQHKINTVAFSTFHTY